MSFSKPSLKNILYLVLIAVFIIPQTRKPLQVFLNRGLALFSPSTIEKSEQVVLKDYHWNLKDENGSVLNFESLQGKVILVNFWATWCPPCIAEMPSMQKLYNDYNDKMAFVFVSNEAFSVTQSFFTKNEYTFKTYLPQNTYPDVFDVSSIPRTFLIDTCGAIVIDKTGAANWNSEAVRETIDGLLEL